MNRQPPGNLPSGSDPPSLGDPPSLSDARSPSDARSLGGHSPCHANGKLFLGIDVGGTNVKLALVDGSGEMRSKGSTATVPLRTPDKVFSYAMEFALRNLHDLGIPTSDLAGVGLAVPGVLDSREHVLREVVNLPGWHGEPLLRLLQETSQRPAAVVNDANSAAYAEHALRQLGEQSLALVTLGTGIGCGVVIQGSPYGGDHGCGGELGHMAIRFGGDALQCTCGSYGHLESYAGSRGVLARLAVKLAACESSLIPPRLSSSDVTPLDIAIEAENGYQLCQDLIDETATYVGQAIGMLGQVIDPAVVLLGGAMTFGGQETQTGRRFVEVVREAVKQTTLVQVGGNMLIEFATLGNDAGVVGAAMVAKQAFKS